MAERTLRPRRSTAGKKPAALRDYSPEPVASPSRVPPPAKNSEKHPPATARRPAPPLPAALPSSAKRRAPASASPLPTEKVSLQVQSKSRSRSKKKSRKEESQPDFYSEPDESEEDSDEEEDESLQKQDQDDDDLLDDEKEDIDFDGMSIGEPWNDELDLAPWAELDPDDIPPLFLPDSSSDLAIPSEYLFRVVEMYEFTRTYAVSLQLSPCLFEDFCTALISLENSPLLSELHLALMKSCWREDDENQIQCTEKETSVSWNILVQLVDQMSYGEVVRIYVQSDSQCPAKVLEAVSHPEYPFVNVGIRLTVLEWFRDRFLEGSEFKKIIKNDGKIQWESYCRACGKLGNVVLCDGCEACYHQQCLDEATLPECKWFCPICKNHQMKGVSDCLPFGHSAEKTPLRMEVLGRDRHARIYWFVCRRLFVHDVSNNDIYYYSTLPQFYEIICRLDGNFYERTLMNVFEKILNDIVEQMAITLELTNARRQKMAEVNYTRRLPSPADATLDMDNLNRMSEILANCWNRAVAEAEGTIEHSLDGETLQVKLEQMLGILNGRLVNVFWTSNQEENDVLAHRQQIIPALSIQEGYKLGFDDEEYQVYKNYASDELAKPLGQRKQERDKKKYVSGRFAIEESGKFEWIVKEKGPMSFNPLKTCRVIEDSYVSMRKKLPEELFHRRWPEVLDRWTKLIATRSVRHLREGLLVLECSMRKPLFLPQWWNSLGTTRFVRTTIDDRERRTKEEAKKKKMERELATADADDDDVVWVKFSRLGAPPKHTLWRQKDEQYRINGKGELGGWIWRSRTWQRKWTAVPEKPWFGKTEKEEDDGSEVSLSTQKALHMESIVSRISKWRADEEHGLGTSSLQVNGELGAAASWTCYSPSCKTDDLPLLVCVDDLSAGYMKCYSSECRRRAARELRRLSSVGVNEEDEKKDLDQFVGDGEPINASDIVKAKNPETERRQRVKQTLLRTQPTRVPGKDVAFPFPKPSRFQRANKKTSLLVLPQLYLRRMARQGGLDANLFYPGFSRTFKANSHVWNYPCARPHTDLCWRWNTLHARSLHAVALQFRLLYACVRWNDLVTETQEEDRLRRYVSHLADRDEIRIVIGHNEMPPDGFYERYKIQVEIASLDDGGDEYEEDRSKKGRKRKSVVVKKKDVRARRTGKTEERWIDGVDLKLWEIVMYWNRRNKEQRQQSAEVRLGDAPPRMRSIAQSTTPRNSTAVAASTPPSIRSSPAPQKKDNLKPLSSQHRASSQHDGCSYIPRPSTSGSNPRAAPILKQHTTPSNTIPATGTPSTVASNRLVPVKTPRQTLGRAPDFAAGIASPTGSRVVAKRVSERLIDGPLADDYRKAVADLPATGSGLSQNGGLSPHVQYVDPNGRAIAVIRTPNGQPTVKRVRLVGGQVVMSGERMTGAGYTYPGGMIRGGGGSTSQSSSSGTAGTGDALAIPKDSSMGDDQHSTQSEGDEAPPIIPRYDDTPMASNSQQSQIQQRRMVRTATGAVLMQGQPQATRKVLMIRRADGTTQFIRPVMNRDGMEGSRSQRVRPDQPVRDNAGFMQGQRRVLPTLTSSRTAPPLRASAAPGTIPGVRRDIEDPFMRRMAGENTQFENHSAPPIVGGHRIARGVGGTLGQPSRMVGEMKSAGDVPSEGEELFMAFAGDSDGLMQESMQT